MTDVADILDRAGDLLAQPGAWTQGSYAKNIDGEFAYAASEGAACWCARGAILRVIGHSAMYEVGPDNMPIFDAADAVIDGDLNISDWNDHPSRTQAEVVAAFRKAAQLARAQGLSS